MKKNGHKIPNDSYNYHDENHDEIELNEIVTGAYIDTQHQSSTHSKTNPIDCHGMDRLN